MSQSTVAWLNGLSDDQAMEALSGCCGAAKWYRSMIKLLPFPTANQLHESANTVFDSLGDTDWLEAFACHPKIGDAKSWKMKLAGNQQWSLSEQSGMSAADERTIEKLTHGNEDYHSRFGYIFIVCATGKSAQQMLDLLNQRLPNAPETEIKIAANEQRKITHLRIDKLLQTNT